MTDLTHFNTKAGAKPYRDLFSTVTIVPPNTSLAYISTQWAADVETGELGEGVAGDYYAQSSIVWANIVGILKELKADAGDIVHRTISFKEFDDAIGKQVIDAMMSVLPEEWKAKILKSAVTYKGADHFHRPGIVYAVELIVAIPPKKDE